MTITLGHYLSLGGLLFALAVIGIYLNRRNLIVLLMAIELMLLAGDICVATQVGHVGFHLEGGAGQFQVVIIRYGA